MPAIDLNPAGVSFEPNTYFRNNLDKIVKIKDCQNDVVFFDYNGIERRLNRQHFGQFLHYFGYQPIDASNVTSTTFSMIEMKSMVESDKSAEDILNACEDGKIPELSKFYAPYTEKIREILKNAKKRKSTSEGVVPTSLRFVKIKSPFASHSAINKKKVEVVDMKTVNFASEKRIIFTVKDNDGDLYEVDEQYIERL